MVKLFALSIQHRSDDGKVKMLKAAHELNSFSYFQRSSVKEFIDFTSKIIAERTSPSSRASVKEQEYLCHVYVRGDGLCGIVIADHEYPQRVAFTLINKILDLFAAKYPPSTWFNLTETAVTFNDCEAYLSKYQNPREADAMTKIQEDLDETKIILHSTIEACLQRGEKLDDLVERSEGLSLQSKTFYKTAKKTNQCCNIL